MKCIGRRGSCCGASFVKPGNILQFQYQRCPVGRLRGHYKEATSGGASGADRLISVSQNPRQARIQKMAIRFVKRLAMLRIFANPGRPSSSILTPDVELQTRRRRQSLLPPLFSADLSIHRFGNHKYGCATPRESSLRCCSSVSARRSICLSRSAR